MDAVLDESKLLEYFDGLGNADRFQKFTEMRSIMKSLKTRYTKTIDVITFNYSYKINGNLYEPVSACEMYHLILNYTMRSYHQQFAYALNYLRYRSDPVFIKICKTLFDPSMYNVKSVKVTLGETVSIIRNSYRDPEGIKLNKSDKYVDATASAFSDPEKIRSFLRKLETININVLKNFHSVEYKRWITYNLPKLCIARAIDMGSMDYTHCMQGYYFLCSRDHQWFRDHGGYYVDTFNKLLLAIDNLPIEHITESVAIHAGDTFICEHLLDLYELQQEKLIS